MITTNNEQELLTEKENCMKNIREFLAALMSMVMLFCLTACGEKKAEAPNTGRYEGISVTLNDEQVAIEEMFKGENYIELSEDGKGKIVMGGETTNLQWSSDNNVYTVTVDGGKFEIKPENGVLSFEFMGMYFVYAKEGADVKKPEASASETKEPENAPSETQEPETIPPETQKPTEEATKAEVLSGNAETEEYNINYVTDIIPKRYSYLDYMCEANVNISNDEDNEHLADVYSFGINSEEKFTAEAYYAVDKTGVVYYSDLTTGDWLEYKECQPVTAELVSPAFYELVGDNYDKVAADENGGSFIIFWPNSDVTDFSIFAMELDENYKPIPGEELYHKDSLTKDENPLEIEFMISDIYPNRAFSFNWNGVTMCYTISISGMDGSLVLTEYEGNDD